MTLPVVAIELIERFPLGFVATVSPDGRPCVSPKGTFRVLDPDTLAFGHVRSPGTLANLAATPEVEVNFIDPFKRKGVRVRGGTDVLFRGTEEFDALIGGFGDIWGDLAERIEAVVKIAVTEAKPLTTPPYDDGVTETEMVALYKAKFAEIYP